MFSPKGAFSGFSVNNLAAAKSFYQSKLGLQVEDGGMGLQLKLPGGSTVFVYEKKNHEPATYTILNFQVDNIDDAVEALAKQGVSFEHYDTEGMKTDAKGIARGLAAGRGPDIAWFKDPAGNFLSVIQNGGAV